MFEYIHRIPMVYPKVTVVMGTWVRVPVFMPIYLPQNNPALLRNKAGLF